MIYGTYALNNDTRDVSKIWQRSLRGRRKMIRGCQRRIYYVKNPGGEVFDEAYFVIRKNYTGRGTTLTGDAELADEAKKIVAQAMGSDDKKRARRARLTAFFAGAAAALAVFAVVLLIVR